VSVCWCCGWSNCARCRRPWPVGATPALGVSPSSKLATVRFYIDADVLGLAKVFITLRPDVTYPADPGGVVHRRERPVCVITDRETPDTVWIPEVTRCGWLIVTRDSRIQERTAEIDAVRTNGARMIALSSADARTTWAQLEVFMSQWRAIERLIKPAIGSSGALCTACVVDLLR
jgi:PIN like domain